jgi:1-acyl-sn-glycerol-3-phosphate acyltransferase
VARMVLEAGVPVLPVAMIGTEKVMPDRHATAEGASHRASSSASRSTSRGSRDSRAIAFVLRSVTDELVYELRRLSGQPYVDVYASSVREQRATNRGRLDAAAARRAAPRFPFPAHRAPNPLRTLPWYSSSSPSSTQIPP